MRIASWQIVLGMVVGLSMFGALTYLGSLPSTVASERTDDSEPSATSKETDPERLFEEQIAPILAQHCLECHDSASRQGRLDLSRQDRAMEGGSLGPAIVPGNHEESLLWEYAEYEDMPPEDRPPLSREQKDLLKQWINAGAIWTSDEIDPLAYTRDRRAAGTWLQRLTLPEYIETVRSTVGVDVEAEARQLLPPDLRADGFTNTAYSLSVDLEHVEAYARLAETIVDRMDVASFVSEFAPCQELDEPCMREVIAAIGKWLLRGPLQAQEIDAFLNVSNIVTEEGGDFQEAVSYVIEAMLQSPRFLYRIEQQSGDGSAQPVSDYELASRLSYILWGGPPDKELMRVADAGELSKLDQLEAQVGRMLEDPRVIDRSVQFIQEWMDLDRLANLRPQREKFPNWDQQLADDMREETLAFFKDVVWEQNRPLADLMNAQVTYLTPRLSEHYGLGRSQAGRLVFADQSDVPERVENGLQALFTFEEGSGETVHDVSGFADPITLKIHDPSAVEWTESGLAVNQPTLIASDQPPTRFIEGLRSTSAITLEAWVVPANVKQDGPARILTLSNGTSARNFTLGQSNDRFEIRLRTNATSDNGEPSLQSSSGTAGTAPVHVVYTRDTSGDAIVYVNGHESGRRQIDGDFLDWNGVFRLALANELSSDRPWQGTLQLVAVYDRALSAAEVMRNQAAGARKNGPPTLQALYRFDEQTGTTIQDVSGVGEPLNLKIEDPSAVAWDQTGLKVNASTRIATDGPPQRLIDAVKRSQAFTLEAWVTPADSNQRGPARIVTLSDGISGRNFTLGQAGNRFEVRFRSRTTDANGLPSLDSAVRSAQPRMTHVVYTRDSAGRATIFINGEAEGITRVGGDLSNWADDFQLALADETTNDRGWRGTYHLVALYSRALTPGEVRSRSNAISRYDLAEVPSRGGLLTQGSTLTIGGDEASMVTRGLFILHDFLYSAVGNPPPCADTTPVPSEPGRTQRAVAEVRVADQSCGGCHSRFEPLAYGLEKFDGVGAYHEVDEHGNPLRDDGEIFFPGADDVVSYDSSAELMDLLAESKRVRMNITRKATQFALGRPLVESDAPTLDQIHASAQEGGGTYESLISSIVLSDLVRMTRTEPTE